MHPWKAPGPDGFPACFYQKAWDIVGGTMWNFVDKVWKNPSVISEVNHTDICLIPKVTQPDHVKQFRPISLCNTNYKIVSKVVVERLKECITDLVSPFQTGFVPGRNIHENIVVAKEMMHSMHRMKGKRGFFAIKVDLAKAYDKISWEFIWRVLMEIKFPEVLINVIMHSVTSVLTNVKWNGARAEFFKPQRGIRQGDPISPYLFVLCMDKLSHLIMHAVEEGRWNGIKAGRHGPVVSHLMFADDLLLFGEANERQMQCVMDTMETFCSMSGQEVSIEKTSILFSRNVGRSVRSRLVHISGYKETNSFGNYLGVPLTGRAPKRSDFQYIIDQVSSKLSAWKANHLSFAGRVTLAKSVIEAVPIYPMMSSNIPKSCLNEIQKMQRQFIWGDTAQKKKFHALSWDNITVPKWMGGLGIRKLDVMNRACLLKLNWKLHSGSEDFWCNVMHGKYPEHTRGTIKSADSSLRKALAKLDPVLQQFSVWNIGDGSDIDAWSTVWIEEGLCLEQQMNIPSHLFGLKVRDLVDDNGSWNWSLFESWMPEEYQQKIAAICPPHHDNGRDVRAGVGGNTSGYSVASMYNNICGFYRKDDSTVWCKIWKIKTPERVRSFMWQPMHNRLITNSLKRKMGLCHAMCVYCGDVEETTLHVLRDCQKAKELWYQLIPGQSRGVFFMRDLHDWCYLNIKNTAQWSWRDDWCETWATTCHCLWSWHNKEMFEEDYNRPQNQVQLILQKIMEYRNATRLSNVLIEQTQTLALIKWHAPKEGFIKINTDGACRSDQLAGCGGVIRGSQGEWIRGFAKNVGRCNAFMAELWGVLKA
jgi:hypothetical protein